MTSLRAAVLGAGWYAAQNHVPVLKSRPEVVLDGVSRLGAEELERVKSHFGFASEDVDAVLARKPDIVVVVTPHQLHYRLAKAASANQLVENIESFVAGRPRNLVTGPPVATVI